MIVTTNGASGESLRGVPVPPQSMIFMDQDFLKGLSYGKHMLQEIRALGAKVGEGNFVDIGCGWGRITYSLLDQDFAGCYFGLDVIKNRIEFLQKAFAANSRFRFSWLDVNNDRYHKTNSKRKFNARDVVQSPADTIIALSVFTHMYEGDIRHYLTELRKIIADDGCLIFTAFILTPQSIEATTKGSGKFTMKYSLDANCRYESGDAPLFAISYDQAFVQQLVVEAGFTAAYEFGTWSGAAGKRFQDWVIARPA